MRDFIITTINEKWVTDITYIHVLDERWTYLASVMDFHGHKINGWAYGKNIADGLVLQAVNNSVLNVKNTQGIILYSGLEGQYTNQLFEEYMPEHKFKCHTAERGIYMIMHV